MGLSFVPEYFIPEFNLPLPLNEIELQIYLAELSRYKKQKTKQMKKFAEDIALFLYPGVFKLNDDCYIKIDSVGITM